MLFKYKALDKTGSEQEGTIETVNEDTAIAALQRNGLVITSVEPADKKDILHGEITFFERTYGHDALGAKTETERCFTIE